MHTEREAYEGARSGLQLRKSRPPSFLFLDAYVLTILPLNNTRRV